MTAEIQPLPERTTPQAPSELSGLALLVTILLVLALLFFVAV